MKNKLKVRLRVTWCQTDFHPLLGFVIKIERPQYMAYSFVGCRELKSLSETKHKNMALRVKEKGPCQLSFQHRNFVGRL